MFYQEIDWCAPLALMRALDDERAQLLYCAGAAREGRHGWSILVSNPRHVFCVREKAIFLDDCKLEEADPFAALSSLLAARKADVCSFGKDAPEFPFVSGVLGFVGYEAAHFIEPSLNIQQSPYSFPDIWFGVYDGALLFSHGDKRSYVVGRSREVCENLHQHFSSTEIAPPNDADADLGQVLHSDHGKATFEKNVAQVVSRIRNGDVFQVNLAHRLCAQLETDAHLDAPRIFETIAGASHADYGALIQCDHGALVSNSPEQFFKIRHDNEGRRKIVVAPIKGTRPRSADPGQDRANANELVADPKERAENVMIADLMRNDLSKICLDDSIVEHEICALKSFANVHHLVSTISGTLPDNVDIGHVFRALFPSGSITGAPKIEAMQIISELECAGRGPYCGAIGYWDDRGLAEFSVAIRTMMIDGNALSVPVGGGITHLSRPAAEFDETIAKSKNICVPINMATNANEPNSQEDEPVGAGS